MVSIPADNLQYDFQWLVVSHNGRNLTANWDRRWATEQDPALLGRLLSLWCAAGIRSIIHMTSVPVLNLNCSHSTLDTLDLYDMYVLSAQLSPCKSLQKMTTQYNIMLYVNVSCTTWNSSRNGGLLNEWMCKQPSRLKRGMLCSATVGVGCIVHVVGVAAIIVLSHHWLQLELGWATCISYGTARWLDTYSGCTTKVGEMPQVR